VVIPSTAGIAALISLGGHGSPRWFKVVEQRKSIKISALNYERLRDLQLKLRYRSIDALLEDLLTLAEEIASGRLPSLRELYERRSRP